MVAVRKALRMLRDLDLELWTEDGGPSVRVDGAGKIFLMTPDAGPETPTVEWRVALPPVAPIHYQPRPLPVDYHFRQ